MIRKTEYRVIVRGRPLAPVFSNYREAIQFITECVSFGESPTDYTLEHRAVTYGEWALTTVEPYPHHAK